MAEETAVCRNCGKELRGKPYHLGGPAYLPLPRGGQAPVNFYGGYVCSYSCDYRAALKLERSMPGHAGQHQLTQGSESLRRVNANWPDE